MGLSRLCEAGDKRERRPVWTHKRHSATCQPVATSAVVGSLYAPTTEASGSSQNAQTTKPTTSRPAATMNGAAHEPSWAKTPKTNGESAPPMFPAMFIIPDTVPEYLPPTSMGTAQDGPMVHSRKNIAAVKQYTAVEGSGGDATCKKKNKQAQNAGDAPARPAKLRFAGLFQK